MESGIKEMMYLQSNEYKSADKPPIALHAIRIPVTMLEAMTPTLNKDMNQYNKWYRVKVIDTYENMVPLANNDLCKLFPNKR